MWILPYLAAQCNAVLPLPSVDFVPGLLINCCTSAASPVSKNVILYMLKVKNVNASRCIFRWCILFDANYKTSHYIVHCNFQIIIEIIAIFDPNNFRLTRNDFLTYEMHTNYPLPHTHAYIHHHVPFLIASNSGKSGFSGAIAFLVFTL